MLLLGGFVSTQAQSLQVPSVILSQVPFQVAWEGFLQASTDNPLKIAGFQGEALLPAPGVVNELVWDDQGAGLPGRLRNAAHGVDSKNGLRPRFLQGGHVRAVVDRMRRQGMALAMAR